jgi:hypothetical protein
MKPRVLPESQKPKPNEADIKHLEKKLKKELDMKDKMAYNSLDR